MKIVLILIGMLNGREFVFMVKCVWWLVLLSMVIMRLEVLLMIVGC